MSLLAEYAPGDSFLHQLCPVTKMAWVLGAGMLCVIFDRPLPLGAIFLGVMILGAAGGILDRLLVFLRGFIWVAVTIFLVQVAFFHGGRVYFQPISAWNWTAVTEEGVRFGIAMVLRTLAMTSLIPLLLCTTELADLVVALVEKVRFPAGYALMLVTILRFIPTFLWEMEQIVTAQRVRGYSNDGRFPWRRWRGLIPVAVPLVRNALERAEDLAVAMQLRGYSGDRRTYLRSVQNGKLDWAAYAVLGLIVGGGLAIRLAS